MIATIPHTRLATRPDRTVATPHVPHPEPDAGDDARIPKRTIIEWPALARLRPGGGLKIIVRCPFCGEKHEHGEPDRSTVVTTRVSHCDVGGYSYTLRLYTSAREVRRIIEQRRLSKRA